MKLHPVFDPTRTMPFRTVSLILSTPSREVFNFLANIENLPVWAVRTCESLRILRGRWYALTCRGEEVVHLEADNQSGAIDVMAGPVPNRMTPLPIRVTALSLTRTLVQMTFIQPSEQSAERYEQEYQWHLEELAGLGRRFGGGELFASAAGTFSTGQGLN